MQPPLLLAFLLAASGVGEAERDVYSVSPYVRAVENTAERVVVECEFPDVAGSVPSRRQSEKSMLAVPATGEVRIQLLEAEFDEFRGGKQDLSEVRWTHDQPEGATDVPIDGNGLIHVERLGVCRDLQLAALEVFRRQDLPSDEGQRHRLFRRIRFEISYPEDTKRGRSSGSSGSSRDPFEEIFDRVLLNASPPPSLRIPLAEQDQESWYNEFPAWARKRVSKVLADGEGLFAIPLTDLSRAKIADPQRAGVSLYDGGNLQQCLVLDGARWQGGALVFYSRDASPFSRWNALWLVRSGKDSLPPLGAEGAMSGDFVREATFTDRYEKDLEFKPRGEANENQEKDWLWFAVEPPKENQESEPFEFLIPLGDLALGATRVDVTLRCVAPKDKFSRRVRITDYAFRVHDQEIPTASLTRSLGAAGGEEHLIHVPIDLHEERRKQIGEAGGISVRVEGLEPEQSASAAPEHPLFVDSIEATYRHRLTLRDGELRIPLKGMAGPWEVAVPEGFSGESRSVVAVVLEDGRLKTRLATESIREDSLVRVAALPEAATQGARELWVLSTEKIRDASFPLAVQGERLLSPRRGADSIFVVHPSLASEISPLVEWHKARGARVEVVLTDEIYDAFGDGTLSPFAIREFLGYAFHAWRKPAPSVVILVGDATWDYKERFGNGIRNYVPGYRVNGIYPTDHWFVSFEGEDKLPEMMIGRLPVFDATTCRTVVRKIVEGYAPPGPWRVRSLMLSDKEPEFVREIDDILRSPYIAPYLRHEWMRLSDFPFSDNYYHPESLMMEEQTKHSPECNQAIIEWLDRGVLLWDFHGHGAPNVLGHERIFFGGGSIYTDVKKLNNGRRYPLFVANTCDTARFDYAEEKWNISLGEDLLQHPNGGCIAMFLHTGRGYPGQHRVIDRLFLDSMFRLGFRRVGQVFTAAKILYLLNPKPPEPLDMMVLVGDPLTPLVLPQEELEVTVTNPRLLRSESGALELEFDAVPGPASLTEAIQGAQYRAYAYVTADDHEIVCEASDLPLSSSALRWKAEIPADVASGEGKVGVYFYPVGESVEEALPDAVGFATFEVEIDPTLEEELASRVLPGGKPNLRIASIVVEPTEPVNGHTIWIDTTVVNDGSGEATNIDVVGYAGEAGEESGAPRIRAWAPRRQDVWTIDRLYPGESGTVRLRWDPFDNAGRQSIQVVLDSKDRIREADETDNSATAEIFVKRKADLAINEKLVASVVKDGTRYLVFRFINIGDCPAEQDFRVDVKFLESEESEPLEVESFAFLWEEGTMPIPARGGFFHSDPMRVPTGAQWAEIVVDPDDIVDEETHENNRVLKALGEAESTSEDSP